MLVYILFLLINIIFVIPFFSDCKFLYKRYLIGLDKIFFIVLCLFMFILMGGRDYSVGVDTAAYARAYQRLFNVDTFGSALSESSFTGPLYVFMSWICHYFSNSPRLFIVLVSLIICFLFYKNFLDIEAKSHIKFFLLWQSSYMFSFSLNGNRQTLASLVQFSSIKTYRNNKIAGLILMILGVLIHPVSLVLPVGYFLGKCLICRRKGLSLIIFGIILGIIINYCLYYLVNLFLILFPSYEKYLSHDSIPFMTNSGQGRIIYFYIFCLVLSFFLSLFFNNKKNAEERIFLLISSICFTIGCLSPGNTFIARIILIYFPLFLYLISRFNIITNRIKHKIYIEILIHIVFIVYFFLNLIENQSGVVPYKFFY